MTPAPSTSLLDEIERMTSRYFPGGYRTGVFNTRKHLAARVAESTVSRKRTKFASTFARLSKCLYQTPRCKPHLSCGASSPAQSKTNDYNGIESVLAMTAKCQFPDSQRPWRPGQKNSTRHFGGGLRGRRGGGEIEGRRRWARAASNAPLLPQSYVLS